MMNYRRLTSGLIALIAFQMAGCVEPTITNKQLNRQLALARADSNREIEALKAENERLRAAVADCASVRTQFENLQRENSELGRRISTIVIERDELDTEVVQLRQLRDETQRLATEADEVKARAAAAEKERDEIKGELQKFIDLGGIGVDATIDGVRITLRDAILFDPGKSALKPGATALIAKLAAVLAKRKAREIRIAGYTDNSPINTPEFPSNWELSSGRALAVLHKLSDVYHLPSAKLVAVGFGSNKPVADNATAEGKARNRRVEIFLIPEPVR